MPYRSEYRANVATTVHPVTATRPLCADVSHDHAEPLAATASRIDHWLLVEYRGVWSADVLGGSLLSQAVKDHLRAQLGALPHSRLLFVRRPERRGHVRLAVYFGRSRERDQRLFGLEIESYDELIDLDVAGALDDGSLGERVEHPLLVVCTHGKRDRCCAKFGQPLYDELRAQVEGDWVWQSTHVGGDRFAGNVVFLPEGVYYGRVERADVWGLLDEHLAGRIAIGHYRGRSCYPFHVQAAERTVRAVTELDEVDDVTFVEAEAIGDDAWRVVFAVAPGAEEHEVDVAAVLGEPTHLTCGATTPKRPRRWEPVAHRVRAPR